MVINGAWSGQAVAISVKPNCLTVSLERQGGGEVFSYDWAGRLWTALFGGVSYRRGLDGKMIAKWRASDGSSDRRWIAPAEALKIEASARQRIVNLLAAIDSKSALLDCGLEDAARGGFEHAIAFDAARSQEDVARYHQVYQPVGILPPDQYMAVVLQATEGCAFNTCTFCDFYKDRPFRIKRPDEFLAHAWAVRDFIGQGLSLRRTVFLGDANALVIPIARLVPMLETIHQVYDVEKLGGVYAFLDGFSAEKKTARDYRLLAGLGLKRIYIGMESGHDALLKFLKKPGRSAGAVKAVQAIKEGGVSVGVIVLLGAGGQVYARQHVRDTIRVLNAMGLDLNDLVYFSELIVEEGMQYKKDAYQAGLKPLTAQERAAQSEAIERNLKFTRLGGIPHISRYDIRDFVY